MQKNGQAKVSRRVKTEQAHDLRLAGGTYRNIAQALGCPPVTRSGWLTLPCGNRLNDAVKPRRKSARSNWRGWTR